MSDADLINTINAVKAKQFVLSILRVAQRNPSKTMHFLGNNAFDFETIRYLISMNWMVEIKKNYYQITDLGILYLIAEDL